MEKKILIVGSGVYHGSAIAQQLAAKIGDVRIVTAEEAMTLGISADTAPIPITPLPAMIKEPLLFSQETPAESISKRLRKYKRR